MFLPILNLIIFPILSILLQISLLILLQIILIILESVSLVKIHLYCSDSMNKDVIGGGLGEE